MSGQNREILIDVDNTVMSGQNREILIDVDTTEDFPVLA
jgi:hypothetical protein